jgi:hypothetical protein
MKIVILKGKRIISGRYCGQSYQTASGIMAVSDWNYNAGLEALEKGIPVRLNGIYFDLNRNMLQYLNFAQLYEFKLASPKLTKEFEKLLDTSNITIKNNGNLYVKDPDKVMFVHDHILWTRQEIMGMPLAPYQSFELFYDNGFSYMGTEPVSVERFMEAVDNRLKQSFRYGPSDGVVITDVHDIDSEHVFAVRVYIGSCKPESEISNT